MTEQSQQRYRVVEKLESGGMAEVFRAESEGLQGFRKQVAIKRVLPHLSSKTKFIQMFLDEARLSAHLSHSNCVQVFDIGVGENTYFIVMEFVDGANLKSVIEAMKKNNREIPIEAALFICIEICRGLSYAHELTDHAGQALKIVHRDISPPNVLITKFGEVKIVDFGLAKASSQLEKSEPGIIKGKFAYLSPEVALGGDVDARTDIFAVGIMLWELLAGKRLFLGESDVHTVRNIQAAVIPPISQINPNVTPELERIVNRALAKEPDDRYRTARELTYDLTKLLFRLGRPVSNFDVASFVHLAMRDRGRQRPQASLIDKLIEETLLEFTSLGERTDAANARRSKPPQGMDLSQWIQESQPPSRPNNVPDPLHHSLPPNIGVGNLAVLEEEGSDASSPALAAQIPMRGGGTMRLPPLQMPRQDTLRLPSGLTLPPPNAVPQNQIPRPAPQTLRPAPSVVSDEGSHAPSRAIMAGVSGGLFVLALLAVAWILKWIPHG